MTTTSNSNAVICRATARDTAAILQWLKTEYDEDGSTGFWCQRNMIQDAENLEHDLWVYRLDGLAVAFQVGNYAAAIISIRKDYRRSGIGTALVEASVARAIRDDINVLDVQCEPATSIKFWRAMGFKRHHDHANPHAVSARRTLARRWALPTDLPLVRVRVRFYDEDAIFCETASVSPVANFNVIGARLDNGLIQLDRRVLGLEVSHSHRDLTVRIEVDDREICFNKAKSLVARQVGVKKDQRGHLVYIDQIEAKANQIS